MTKHFNMGFFKSFFASCLGTLVALIALFILMIAFFSALTSENQIVVSDNSVLHLKLDAPITEQEFEDPISEIYPQIGNQSIGLIQLKQVLKNAKTDPKISGIYLNASELTTGFSSVEEVRNALLDFRLSGKWVIAYSTSYSEGAYYLSSASDKVYLFPEGQLEFNGLATEVMFYKKLFDKLEIKPQVFRVGDFKSAVEPFVREDLSAENKLQLNSLLNSIYDEMLGKVSDSRKIPKDRLKQISDQMLVRNAKLALENKLVDSLFYEDQVKAEMKTRLGLSEDDDINLVSYARYRRTFSTVSTSANEIAVVVAEGEITSGEADQGIVGSETFVKEIRKARTNDNVKAIVLRINSPGGEFQASDEMWREVVLATEEKPVIASMSDYAASGGYYLAMACDTIVAQPNTITGSIGIFSILFDLSSFLDNKIGLTTEEVKTGEFGQMFTMTRPLTEMEKSIWQKQTEEVYETFTGKAALGRNMSQDDIKRIASGRVWTGSQAKNNGLVDILGGFDDAINIAAQQGGIADDYKLRYYPSPKNFLERLTGGWEESAKSKNLRTELGDYYAWYVKWLGVKKYQGTQARMPFDFILK